MDILNGILPTRVAYAHCDVPCGIYTPEPAKTAADTVAKMVEKIQALPKDNLYRLCSVSTLSKVEGLTGNFDWHKIALLMNLCENYSNGKRNGKKAYSG